MSGKNTTGKHCPSCRCTDEPEMPTNGTSTSEMARRFMLSRRPLQWHRILRLIVARPSTDEELQKYLHIKGNSQRPRRVELQMMELIELARTTRPNESGMDAEVWKSTSKGRIMLDVWSRG